ncbi:MAG TPA: hypothetical protein DCR55_05880 [Lentisphaeria bacterium]|nr:hypothetical protein [Lentisphaeria bacterium]
MRHLAHLSLLCFIVAASVCTAETPYQRVTNELDPGGEFYLYMSAEKWYEAFSEAVSSLGLAMTVQQEDMREDVEGGIKLALDVVGDMGLRDLGAFGGSVVKVDELFRHRYVIARNLDAEPSRLWSLAPDARAQDLLDYVPQDAVVASFGTADLGKVWDWVIEILENPLLAEQNESFETAMKDLKVKGVDVEAMVRSANLNQGICLTIDASKVTEWKAGRGAPKMEIPAIEFMLVLSVEDGTIFEYLETVLKDAPKVEKSAVDGFEIRSVNFPMPLPIALKPTFAYGNGLLFVASNEPLLTNALAVKRGDKPGLKEAPEFQMLAAHLPPTPAVGLSFLSERFGKEYKKIIFSVYASQAGKRGMGMVGKSMATWGTFPQMYGINEVRDDLYVSTVIADQNLAAAAVGRLAMVPFGIVAATVVPAIGQADKSSSRAVCQGHLKQLGVAVQMFALDNNSTLPRDLSSLKPYLDGGAVTCPRSKQGYVYAGVGVEMDVEFPGKVIIAHDVPGSHGAGVNVLFLDGHVDFTGQPLAEYVEQHELILQTPTE